ncbi:hypothetical protein J6590_061957 [Homalodisca vitripennis]|nr:hypothetical protein J6590_061957 [Homalodisca vitripennis]
MPGVRAVSGRLHAWCQVNARLGHKTAALCTAAGADGLGEVEEVMEDFPLDDPGGEGDTSSEEGGGQTMDASTSDDDNG